MTDSFKRLKMRYLKSSPLEFKQRLKSYLYNGTLMEDFGLRDTNPLNGPSFHWANWKETCDFERWLIEKGIRNSKEIQDHFEDIKNVPLWVKNGHHFKESNLFGLYNSMADSRVREILLSRKEETLISLSNESGPYMSLKSMRWFDKNLYKAFIFDKILHGKFPLRSFRLIVDIPVACSFGRDLIDTTMIKITQINEEGLLFQILGASDWSHFRQSNCVFWKFNWEIISSILGVELEEQLDSNNKEEILCLDTRVIDEYTNPEACKKAGSFCHDIFVRYDDFSSEGRHPFSIGDYFFSYITLTENLFKEMMKEIKSEEDKKSAA